MRPLFTIVLPTHNRQELLDQAIGSVLQQQESDWELIVVDDASEPPARVPEDQRIRLLRNERSQGPAAARNVGLKAATGTYIAFLDDDDLWTSSRLRNARKAHERADLAICGEGRIGDQSPQRRLEITLHSDAHDWVLDATAPPTGRVSVRRINCPEFDTAYRAAEDLDWWLRVTEIVQLSAWFDSADWQWRKHDGPRNDLGNQHRVDGSRQLLRAHESYFVNHRRARAFRWRRISLMCSDLGQPLAALRAGCLSIVAKPTWGGFKALAHAFASWLRPEMDRNGRKRSPG